MAATLPANFAPEESTNHLTAEHCGAIVLRINEGKVEKSVGHPLRDLEFHRDSEFISSFRKFQTVV